jgi:hypothetical protein
MILALTKKPLARFGRWSFAHLTKPQAQACEQCKQGKATLWCSRKSTDFVIHWHYNIEKATFSENELYPYWHVAQLYCWVPTISWHRSHYWSYHSCFLGSLEGVSCHNIGSGWWKFQFLSVYVCNHALFTMILLSIESGCTYTMHITNIHDCQADQDIPVLPW